MSVAATHGFLAVVHTAIHSVWYDTALGSLISAAPHLGTPMNRKRLIIYSLLATPLIVFTIFFFTLDPIARGTFFREFKTKLAAQFGFADTNDFQVTDASQASLPTGGDFGGGESGESGDNGPAGGGPGGGGPGGGRPDPAAFFASQDANGDGQWTEDEIPDRMRDNLDRIDTDGDGAITMEEFQAFRSQFAGRGGRGGGGRGGRGGGPGGGGPGGGGGQGDGSGPAAGGGRRSIEENFANQDKDGDGQLVGDEVTSQMRNSFEQIDTDGNEALTLDELRAFVARRSSGRGGRGGGRGNGNPREGRPERPARPEAE